MADYSWTPYPWAEIRRALSQRNQYRYGLVVPEKPRAIAHHKTPGTRLFRVPEGWLILSRHPEVKGIGLQDLSQHPIRTGPFLLTWGAMKHDRTQRARLTVSPRWIREKARYVNWVTHGITWPGGKPKAPRQILKGINAITREIRYAARYAMIPPETARRWDKLIRRNLWRFFTGTLRLGEDQSKALLKGAIFLNGRDQRVKKEKGGTGGVV